MSSKTGLIIGALILYFNLLSAFLGLITHAPGLTLMNVCVCACIIKLMPTNTNSDGANQN